MSPVIHLILVAVTRHPGRVEQIPHPDHWDRDGSEQGVRRRAEVIGPVHRRELCWILGDGVDQAADISWFATSIPSRNFTPRTIFGN